MVRAAQKGEMEDPSPEITKVASTVSKSDVKKMASTKHKGLPEKVPFSESQRGYQKSQAQKSLGSFVKAGADTVRGAAIVGGAALAAKRLADKKKVNEGVINAYKKGINRHKKAVEDKKVKNRKAIPYAALSAQYSPELPEIGESKCKCDCGKVPCVTCGSDHHKKEVKEAKVDKGRSDYGKATIRNWRRSGPSTVEPAMFDPENKRGKTIDKRREEHKARRGVKGAKVPTYKKEEFELEEERSARKMNVRTKKTIQTTIAKNAAAEAKRKEKKTGEYKETPKKKPKLGLGYKTVVKHAQAKKAAAKTPITRATAKKAEKKTAPSTKSDARTKAQYKGKGAPGLDAHKERIAKHEAKRGVKKPKAAKKTPVTKATTTKPAPKKAPARKSVTSTPITKAASTPKKKKTFGDFVKDGVKRHKKATQGARVFGKGFAKGVKKSVKFAKDVKKVVTNEQVNKISKMVKAIRRKKEVLKQPSKSSYVGKRDAGAIAAKKMRDKEHNKYVNFLGADD